MVVNHVNTIYVNNNIGLYDILIRKSVYSFRTQLYDSHNSLISCIMFGLLRRVRFMVIYEMDPGVIHLTHIFLVTSVMTFDFPIVNFP